MLYAFPPLPQIVGETTTLRDVWEETAFQLERLQVREEWRLKPLSPYLLGGGVTGVSLGVKQRSLRLEMA